MEQPGRYPTPFPFVNEVLQPLLAGARAVLATQFYGLYLYGSLASGDFDPKRSDIDFLVVTEGRLAEQNVTALRALHEQLWASGGKWAGKLEGAYLPRQMLRRYEPNGPAVPSVNEGKFYLAPLGSDWVIQYYLLREFGAAVEGPRLRELIEPVTAEALGEAVVKVLDEWWKPMLNDHHWLERSEYQAYAVQTMFRALYSLREGGMISKAAAMRWAKIALDERWRDLVEWAERWPENQDDRLGEVLDLVRYTLAEREIALRRPR